MMGKRVLSQTFLVHFAFLLLEFYLKSINEIIIFCFSTPACYLFTIIMDHKIEVEDLAASLAISPALINERIATHSHIKGLGLNEKGYADSSINSGLIGQFPAREAAGIIVDMVKYKKMAGRAVLLTGEPGTGKTAIAMAISQELGRGVPFFPMIATEVYSAEVKKTEILMENFRRAIGLKIKEIKEVYEGEVIELKPHEVENPLSENGKTIAHITIILKSSKGMKTLKLDPNVLPILRASNIRIGDIVYIESNSGAIKRLGRCDIYKQEHDLEADEYLPIPKTEVEKKKEIIQEITLYDLDVAVARPEAGNDLISLMNQVMKPKKIEITDYLRKQVNSLVNKYIEEGKAQLIPGVLFIDEAHMLDIECFGYLNRAIESDISPTVILATNRGNSKVKGTEGMECPHGMPLDLLDRLLIIKTLAFKSEEICEILKIRANICKILIDQDALEYLAQVGSETSLRYSLQLLTMSNETAKLNNNPQIKQQDIVDTKALFLDPKRAMKLASETPGYLMQE